MDIVQPLMGEVLIHGVHDGDFLVQDHIRIIGDTVGDNVLALEQVYLVVVYAYIFDVVGDGHSAAPHFVLIYGCIIHKAYPIVQ
jgi:hypothetical protein